MVENKDTILNILPIGAYVYQLTADNRLILVDANPAADKIIGINHSQLIGRDIEECFPQLKEKGLIDVFVRVAREGGHERDDNLHYDEGQISGVFEFEVVRHKPGHCLVLFRDVTEERRRDKSQREQEAWLRSIMNAAPIGIGVKANGQIIHSNQALCEMTGYSIAELVGMPHEQLFASESDYEKVSEKEQAGDDLGGRSALEARLRKTDGSVLEVMYSSMPMDTSDLSRGYSFVVLDISDQKKAARQHEALQARNARFRHLDAVGALADDIGHDLSNVLGPILGFSEVILNNLEESGGDQQLIDTDELREDLQRIQTAARRASEVVKDLQIIGGREPLTLKNDDLRRIVRLAYTDLCKSNQKDRCRMVFREPELGDVPLFAKISAPHLKRALINVMRNSLEAVSGRGAVKIRTYAVDLKETLHAMGRVPPGRYAVVEVDDSGCGIPDKLRDRIFDPFVTCQSGGKKTGSGLGLAIVKSVVNDHNGYIEIKSEEAVGTTLSIYLPLGADASEGDSDATTFDDTVFDDTEGNGLRGRKERILVAEDEPQQRYFMRRALEKLGYSMELAVNGSEAIEKCSRAADSSPYDLVILDMVMDDRVDGLRAFDEIRRINPKQRIMIVSGYQPAERVRKAMGIDACWLTKPFSIKQLAETVRAVLAEPA